MPFVEVFTVSDIAAENKQKLLSLVQTVVADAFAAQESTVTVWMHETAVENVLHGGSSAAVPVQLVIHCFSGRSFEQKRKLYQRMACELEALLGDVFCQITVEESGMENWGIRNGKCAADIMMKH